MIGGRTVSRRGAALVLLGLVFAALAVMSAERRSFADDGPDGYQMVAAADGVRVTWTVPNFAVVDSPVDGGGPSAQARLDSLGQSSAFASLPYPGDAFVGLPGLLAGFTGLPAAPAYPFYVRSSHPTVPDEKFEPPGAALAAHSDAGSSVASAAGGEGGAGELHLPPPSDAGELHLPPPRDARVSHPASEARTVRADDGTLTATARSAVDAVAVGPLALRGLVSTATVVRTPDGRETVTSSLAAASASVGGTAVELNDRGLVVAGNATPLAADAVTQALTKAGIQVALTQAAATDHGVVAPSLSVTFSQYSDLIQRPVTIRYLLGASSASVLGGAPAPLPGPDVIPPGGSTVGPTDAAPPVAGRPASDGAPAPGGPSSVPAGRAPALSGGTAASDGSGGEAAQGAPPPTRPARTGAPARRPFSPVASESAGWAWGSLYLVLVAAALVLAGGVELIRTLGVRKP